MGELDQEYLAERLRETRWRVAQLVVMSLRPDQEPERLRLLAQLERSARAEVKLRRKALQWAQRSSTELAGQRLSRMPAS